jgi:hypothetical protein
MGLHHRHHRNRALHELIAGSARTRICAVFAIIAFLDVPMVIISARFLPDVHRASFEFTSPWQYAAFFMSMIATVMLAGVLISLRTDLIKLKALLEQQTSIGD